MAETVSSVGTSATAGALTVRSEVMVFCVCAGLRVTKVEATSPILLLKRKVRSSATVDPAPTRSALLPLLPFGFLGLLFVDQARLQQLIA